LPTVKVTAAELGRFAPKAKPEYRDHLIAHLDTTLEPFGINRRGLRLSHFMAQIGHECGLFTIKRESMAYTTVARILEIFGVGNHSAKVTPAEAPGLVRQPKKLAERVYGLGNPKMARDLGNTEVGDGFKFRGAGFLQITGRDSYTRHGRAIGVDLTADSDLAAEPENSLRLACEEWKEKGANKLADDDDLRALTKAINGGVNGLPDRRRLLAAAKAIWGNKPAT
jgi:putative chitinase